MITIDVSSLYVATETAKLSQLSEYEAETLRQAGSGNIIKLTGAAPIWLYLRLAHALHGKVLKLLYDSPASGEVTIFDHDPY